jgi:hypothetical protein
MQFVVALRNSRLSGIPTAMGAGGKLKIYTGSPPGAANAATGTLLSTLTAVVFGTPAAGAMSISATADSSAAATGTPGYYRFTKSDDTVEIEGTAGVGSGEDSFDSGVSLGGNVSLTSGTITEGNA